MSKLDLSKLSNKKHYTISEVSNFLEIKQTEIRYWEKFEPKLRSKSINRRYNLKKIKLLLKIKKLIKEEGIKPSKIGQHLKPKKNPIIQNLEIKKELLNIKNIIKKTSKL